MTKKGTLLTVFTIFGAFLIFNYEKSPQSSSSFQPANNSQRPHLSHSHSEHKDQEISQRNNLEINIANKETLRIKMEEFFNSFPNKEDLNDPHHFPSEWEEQSKLIGDVKQGIIDGPLTEREGLEFYLNCSYEDSLPLSFRALCLKNAYFYSLKLDNEIPQALLSLPTQITELALKL